MIEIASLILLKLHKTIKTDSTHNDQKAMANPNKASFLFPNSLPPAVKTSFSSVSFYSLKNTYPKAPKNAKYKKRAPQIITPAQNLIKTM